MSPRNICNIASIVSITYAVAIAILHADYYHKQGLIVDILARNIK